MKDYSESKQWDFGVDVITRFGYDWQNGRQDKAAHPFTTTFGYGDIRITTRFLQIMVFRHCFPQCMKQVMECMSRELAKNLGAHVLFTGASMAIHESQSRMFENLVGRSLEFWTFFYPRYQALHVRTSC